MKKILKLTGVSFLALLVLGSALVYRFMPDLPGLLVASVKARFAKPPPPEQTLTRVEYYRFDPASGLEQRVKLMPLELFEDYRALDKAPEYERYEPAAADKALLLEYLALLPPVYRSVFEERCLGIYFIKNLKGNGLTSWASDGSGKVFFHITLNSASLTTGLSAALTARETSCFIPQPGWSVKVDAGTKYKGLLYALFHEGTHGVDYAKGVTPWTDNDMPAALRPARSLAPVYFVPYWSDFYLPVNSADYPLRGQITFYGLNGGPKIPFNHAPSLYRGLAASPFASLYGSLSWSEDLAELATFHMLTQKLRQPYRITVSGPGTSLKLRPMKPGTVAYLRAALVMKELDPKGGQLPRLKLSSAEKDLDKELEKTDELLRQAEGMINED